MSNLSSRFADYKPVGFVPAAEGETVVLVVDENRPLNKYIRVDPKHEYATEGTAPPIAESQDARARRILDAVDRELHRLTGVGWKGIGVEPEIEAEISNTLLLKIKFALEPEAQP